MTRLSRSSFHERLTGHVGLLLLVLVALAADRAYSARPDLLARITGLACRGLIDAVGVVGWLVDRVPPREQPLAVAPVH